MLNNEIKEIILNLNMKRENGLNSSEIANLIRKRSIEVGLTYEELYKLLYDKDYLLKEVNIEVSGADKRIEKLMKEIDELKLYKKEMSKIICEIYGHKFTNYKETNIQTCEICGKQEFIPSDNRYLFLSKRYKH